MDYLAFHDIDVYFLDGTKYYADGGATFGPVPRAVWGREMPFNDAGQIAQVADPILIHEAGHYYLIDTSHGTSKMGAKARRNAGLETDNHVFASLAELNLTPKDIDGVIMTHMHNDHAGGLTYLQDGRLHSSFPKAKIYINEVEWQEVRYPNARTQGTYLKANWEPIQAQVETFGTSMQLTPSIHIYHTGGHSNGHSIIRIEQEGEALIHLADLMLTHPQRRALWISGYDDYPMDSVRAKEYWLPQAFEAGDRFIFYHNPYYTMLQFSEDGKEIIDQQERSKEPLISRT
ncbi:hypothetical protein CL176_00810 [Suicoccus acidiformans]|uniref:Metallo-beta-lactamase domain-containing protein n=1 Tax=Suicoccus acidiformans TaxID=2036206 RepID=A0A347WHX7_9LACT|nr:MBL fold metallo-hydrolase [Suicoccus acidiformans]AXY24684.1 hypothetical protein CL176_00810 [Suicoccus acidiformans]